MGVDSYAGIVSKDGSKVYSENVNFDGVKIPFAAYQKKNEYNFPSLDVKDYTLKNFIANLMRMYLLILNLKMLLNQELVKVGQVLPKSKGR